MVTALFWFALSCPSFPLRWMPSLASSTEPICNLCQQGSSDSLHVEATWDGENLLEGIRRIRLKQTKQRNLHVLQLLNLPLIGLSAFTLAQGARRIPSKDKSDHLIYSRAMALHSNQSKSQSFSNVLQGPTHYGPSELSTYLSSLCSLCSFSTGPCCSWNMPHAPHLRPIAQTLSLSRILFPK